MDFNIESRSLLLRRNSHRIHRSLLLRRNSHRFHGFTQKFIAEKEFPQNSQNTQKFITEKKLPQISDLHRSLLLRRDSHRIHRFTQKFIAEKKLPQISRIYTDVSKMFCVFREFCGSKYLCKSVKSVGEYSLPVCSEFREFCGRI